jgi:hypothetical protein
MKETSIKRIKKKVINENGYIYSFNDYIVKDGKLIIEFDLNQDGGNEITTLDMADEYKNNNIIFDMNKYIKQKGGNNNKDFIISDYTELDNIT